MPEIHAEMLRCWDAERIDDDDDDQRGFVHAGRW